MSKSHSGRIRTVVNDRIRRNTMIYMVQYYDRISPSPYTQEYGNIRSKIRSFTILVYAIRIRSPFCSVFLLYTIVFHRIRSWRYTIVIRYHVIRQNTVVNDRIFPVYGGIRPFTESVTLDLGKLNY